MQCRETVTLQASTGQCVTQLVFPQSLKIGAEKLQTFFFFFFVIGRLVREPEEMQYESFHCAHFFSFIKLHARQKSTNTNGERDSTDVSGRFAAAGVTTAGLRSRFFCLCFCSAEVIIVLGRGGGGNCAAGKSTLIEL